MTRPAPMRALAALLVAGLAAGCGSAAAAPAGALDDQLAFGVQMAQRGLWSEATFRFEQARTLAPRDRRVLNNLAVSYEAVGRFDDALAAYRSALEAAPADRKLRQNYTRFLEFYQSFKVRRPGAPPAAPAETPPAPAPAEAPPAPDGSGR